MVLEAVACKHCGQTQQVRRYGTTRGGTQRYRCFDCGRTFVKTYTHKARDPLVKAQIIQLGLNGSGVRDTARVLGINRNTVSSHFKKSSQVLRVNPNYVDKDLMLSLKVDESCRAAGAVVRRQQTATTLAMVGGRRQDR